jgi:hypothetical protein
MTFLAVFKLFHVCLCNNFETTLLYISPVYRSIKTDTVWQQTTRHCECKTQTSQYVTERYGCHIVLSPTRGAKVRYAATLTELTSSGFDYRHRQIYLFPRRPYRFWGQPSLLADGGSICEVKVAGTWS